MPKKAERGRKSAGAILLENQRDAASQLKNFHRQMRKIGPKGPVLPAQKNEAAALFKKLESIFSTGLYGKAREIYGDEENPRNRDEIKKIALALYLEGYLKEAHRHALKANVSGDFALFLSTFESVLDFLDNNYFSNPIEQVAIDFIILKGSLDACAEACRIASLDFNPAKSKYADQTIKFLIQVEEKDQKTG